jgi:hypothetical protein
MAWFITYSAAFESGMRDERTLKQPLTSISCGSLLTAKKAVSGYQLTAFGSVMIF